MLGFSSCEHCTVLTSYAPPGSACLTGHCIHGLVVPGMGIATWVVWRAHVGVLIVKPV